MVMGVGIGLGFGFDLGDGSDAGSVLGTAHTSLFSTFLPFLFRDGTSAGWWRQRKIDTVLDKITAAPPSPSGDFLRGPHRFFVDAPAPSSDYLPQIQGRKPS
ncbi:MAG: hypothetical protein QNK37_37215 [Acidobacteriota bacterium]|nr:hypothetical protein [Acidobacteriota bacterium]